MKGELRAAGAGHAAVRGRPAGSGAGRTTIILSVIAVSGLAAATALGLLPGVAGPDLHAAVGLPAAALAAAAHIRWRDGRDLLATLLLAVGALLGMGVTGGLVSRGAHGAAALIAALVSMEVHGEHLWQRLRS